MLLELLDTPEEVLGALTQLGLVEEGGRLAH
jgi:hypothetical protein